MHDLADPVPVRKIVAVRETGAFHEKVDPYTAEEHEEHSLIQEQFTDAFSEIIFCPHTFRRYCLFEANECSRNQEKAPQPCHKVNAGINNIQKSKEIEDACDK